jgi:hypothetical protein
MTEAASIRAGILGCALLLAGCASATPEPARPVAAVAAPVSIASTGGVIGLDAGMLASRFGKPDLDVREGSARKLQFVGPACVLDAYLYPPAPGREPVVNHVDARLPDGRDMDRASCVAALSRREEAR